LSPLKNIVATIGAIGALPSDSEQIRLLKRIWTITLALGAPLSAGIGLVYLLLGRRPLAVFWLISAGYWFFSLFLFSVVRNHIGNFGWSSQAYLVLSSFVMTCLMGGMFRSDGVIFMGLIGVLYAMVFPSRPRAFVMLLLYGLALAAALALEITAFRADAVRPAASTIIFWAIFINVAFFTVVTIYYFVGQRDRAFRLLEAEKERSDGLLRRIEKDLALAAQIQRDFLPRRDPRLEHYDISGANVSCREVGGDYFDFVPVDPHRLGIAVGDVSGKGIGAALLMAALRAAFRADVHPGYQIEGMAAKLNDFVHYSSAISTFVTFFYCEADRTGDEIRYVNAGHNPPLVLRTDGTLENLDSTGFCLGMFSGAVYEAKSVRLRPGDVALLFTDGIPESRNAAGEEYTMDRLIAILRSNAHRSAAEIVSAISAEAKDFIRGAEQCDDQTLVVIKKT